jgi:hypothetical protein
VVFFEADVVAQHPAECGDFRFDAVPRGQLRFQLVNLGADSGVVGQHPDDVAVAVHAHVTCKGRQQDFFFLAKVFPPGGLPEAQKFAGLLPQRFGTFASGESVGAADEQRLDQRVVVVLAERMQTRMSFHTAVILSQQ